MKRLIAYTSLIILSINKLYAFDLFDPERGKEPPPPPPVVAEPPKPKEEPPPPVNPFATPLKPPPVQKDFVLRGTSRIGNSYKVILQPPDGKPPFIQDWVPEKVNKVKGYEDFILLKVESRQVTVAYPEESCLKDNPQVGVKCSSDKKIATLKLTARDAIPVATPPAEPTTPPPNPFALAAAAAMAANNATPEELAKREEEIAKRREIYQNFQRQVIKDEDVPPGMRVVRTPFGDRLVPDNGNETEPPPVKRNQGRR